MALVAILGTPLQATDKVRLNHESLFDRSRLLDIHIEMAVEDWNAVRSQTRALAMALRKPAPPTPFTYVKGNITIDGYRIESVGIRKKGFVGSLDQNYPSLKIKFDEYVDQDPIDGSGRLTLNNNKQDKTLVSQSLAYKLFADAKLPAPRCNFARVTVNGDYLGIYSNVESVKKPFLERQFGNEIGKLYEGSLADFFVDKLGDFESKTGDGQNRDELRDLAEMLAKEGDLDLAELERHIDVAQFLRFWALEALINCWDGYTNNQNNYFVYHNPRDSRFHFIPWGADATFVRREFVKSRRESVHGASVLANRLYQTEGMPDRYREVLLELLETVWNEDSILAEIDRLEAQLKDHTHARQKEFTSALDQTRSFVKTRRHQLAYELDRWPVELSGKPRRPMFTKSVGSVTGTFSTKWAEKPPQDPYDSGEAQLEMVLDGERVKFSRLGVYAEQKQDREGNPSRNIVFIGKRASNRIRIKLLLGMSDARFRTASSKRPIVVQGNLEEGGFGLFGILSTHGVRLVGGWLTLSDAGPEIGDVVSGSVTLDVMRIQHNR